jgi:hypothetical protein
MCVKIFAILVIERSPGTVVSHAEILEKMESRIASHSLTPDRPEIEICKAMVE